MCYWSNYIICLSRQGLADESEFIRETSLRAGQTIVSRYADTALELFLPELERGLFDDNWRIRYLHCLPGSLCCLLGLSSILI